jgi:outer membrane protein assembly factor BamA
MFRIALCFAVTLICVSTAMPQRGKTINVTEVVIRELVIGGTRTLDNTELNEITSSLVETRSNDSSKELGDRVRDTFQQRGYFDAEVKHVKFKALDPLAVPKLVRVEAEVEEGPRYRPG